MHKTKSMKPWRVFLLIGMGHVVGAAAGVGVALLVFPPTGELSDAFRWPFACLLGFLGFMLSGIYSAWLSSRYL